MAAEGILPLAAHIARTDAADLTLLHVLEARPNHDGLHATDAIEWDLERRRTRDYLDDLAEDLRDPSVVPQVMVAEGEAAPQVVTIVDELQSDLIALSTHGEGECDSWLLGSTAQKILTVAPSAILVVPSRSRGYASNIPLRRIFIPLDGSVRGVSVLPTALRLARRDGAEIILAHVVSEPIRTDVLSTPEDLALAEQLAGRLEARAGSYLEQVRASVETSGVRARAINARSTDQREGLVTLAEREQADLVVLSAHGAVCNARRRFGSVASYFISHSRAPILVMQDLPAHSCARAPASPRTPSRADGRR